MAMSMIVFPDSLGLSISSLETLLSVLPKQIKTDQKGRHGNKRKGKMKNTKRRIE